MRIGELARRSGVAATALRYYEKLGLLPAPERTASGYRAYTDAAVDRLAFIRSAQTVGLTLAEVREVLRVRDAGTAPCGVVSDLIEQRHAEVRSRLSELRDLERELASLRLRAVTLEPRDCDPSGVCDVIQATPVDRHVRRLNIAGGLSSASSESGQLLSWSHFLLAAAAATVLSQRQSSSRHTVAFDGPVTAARFSLKPRQWQGVIPRPAK